MFEETTHLTTKFIRNSGLLLGSMALFALLKLLTVPATTPKSKRPESWKSGLRPEVMVEVRGSGWEGEIIPGPALPLPCIYGATLP